VIASVRGTLADTGPGWCIIEAGGVGYLIHVSAQTAASLPERGGTVHLRTRQVVREDAITLYGFSDPDELRLFDLVIGVSGVGPRLAIALLSGLRPATLVRAIRD
jgi:Holliday junction DNA helicase RuvA